jgi:Flp pilus assembly protein TadG
MQLLQHGFPSQKLLPRKGAAVVEAALLLPMLIAVTFGAVDVAQYINLSQIVSNASREGALVASDFDTLTLQEVEDAVTDYLHDCHPRLSPADLAAAVTIEVQDADNQAIAPMDLASVPAGDPLLVRVAFDFSAIRWLTGPDYWDDNIKTSQTFCRRE